MAYNKTAQKRYTEKCVHFTIKYFLNDLNEGLSLKKYLKDNGISANSYLKSLIKTDLVKKGFIFDENTDLTDENN